MKILDTEARIIDLKSVKRDQPGAADTIAYATANLCQLTPTYLLVIMRVE